MLNHIKKPQEPLCMLLANRRLSSSCSSSCNPLGSYRHFIGFTTEFSVKHVMNTLMGYLTMESRFLHAVMYIKSLCFFKVVIMRLIVDLIPQTQALFAAVFPSLRLSSPLKSWNPPLPTLVMSIDNLWVRYCLVHAPCLILFLLFTANIPYQWILGWLVPWKR